MKKLFFLLLLAFLSVTQAMAYDFEVGGIYYNINGTNATVTFKDGNYNSYSGDVVIPETVTYDEVTYNVNAIGTDAFKDCSNLTNILIPRSVTSISTAFSGCSSLESMTLPFVGNSAALRYDGIGESNNVFGYIFGRNPYNGSIEVLQKYYSSTWATCTYHIPSSLKNVTITGNTLPYGAFSGCANLMEITRWRN